LRFAKDKQNLSQFATPQTDISHIFIIAEREMYRVVLIGLGSVLIVMAFLQMWLFKLLRACYRDLLNPVDAAESILNRQPQQVRLNMLKYLCYTSYYFSLPLTFNCRNTNKLHYPIFALNKIFMNAFSNLL
jgi:hypothetical protein